MNLLVPFDRSTYASASLREACRIAGPLDTIVVMVHVREAAPVPLAKQDEAYYQRRWRAEVLVTEATDQATRFGYDGAGLLTVLVAAPDQRAAIVAAAEHWAADRIIMKLPAGWYGHLRLLFHPVLRGLVRDAPCAVQFTFARPGTSARRRTIPYHARTASGVASSGSEWVTEDEHTGGSGSGVHA